ncbi:MAG: hypothetical protein U0234_22705 [Sandaracinus sp.]
MSRARPGSGVRVSGGKLRVDAARAVAKLRSYQLADPFAWVLEVVRAGASFPGASSIAVDGSGGDVFVSIACEPPEGERLLALFEELVDPGTDPQARALRLLAIGVNAALGRRGEASTTHHVDVFLIEEGGSRRARFTPRLLTVEDETGVATGLRELRLESALPPSSAPRIARGLVVHVRAVLGLGVLARWAIGEEPRELRMVRDAAREVAVPLTVAGIPLAADASIVLSEPVPGGGWVALALPRPGRAGAVLEASERGVVLSREPWTSGLGSAAPALVPLLYRVDRERLPTNAARSAVRWDDADAADALAAGQEALGPLIARLATAIDEASDPGRLSWLRALGISLLASEVAGPSHRARLVVGPAGLASALAPLFDAKLLFDAVGRRRSVRELFRAGADGSVHYGALFAERELAAWVGDLLAAPPGDPTHLLFGDVPPPSAELAIQTAREAVAQQARWRRQPALPSLARRRDQAFRCVPLPADAGPHPSRRFPIEGEIAIGVPGNERTLELRREGRPLEVRHAKAEVGIEIVVQSDALVPTPRFDAAVGDETTAAVLDAVEAATRAACEAIAKELVESSSAQADPRALAAVRQATLTLVAREAEKAREILLGSPLGHAPVWPDVRGTRHGLVDLARGEAIGVIERGKPAPPRSPAGRPVLALSDAERTALSIALPRVPLVDYGRFLGRPGPLRAISATLGGSARVAIDRESPGRRWILAWTEGASGIEAFHVGRRLGLHPATLGHTPTVVVVDDDDLVPDASWAPSSVAWSRLEQDFGGRHASARLAREIVRAWLGEEVPGLTHEVPLDDAAIVRSVLREVRSFEAPLSPDARAAVAKLPIFPGWSGARLTGEALREAGGGKIAYATRKEPTETGLALIALDGSREEAEGLAALVGGAGTTDATQRIESAIAQHQRDTKLARIARGPEQSLDPWGATPTVRVLGDGLTGVLGFRPSRNASHVAILVGRRAFVELEDDELPPHLAAKVDVEPRLLDERAEKLHSALGVPRVRGALLSSARQLAALVVRERPASLFGDEAVTLLVRRLVGGGRRRGEVGAMMRTLAALPTLATDRGPPVSIEDATRDEDLAYVTDAIAALDPTEDETPTPLDRPLPILSWEEGDERRALLETIAGATLVDVTDDVRALHAARRAARGLVERPALRRGHEPSLARPIEELAESTSDPALVRKVLGIGTIGLVREAPSLVRFFDAGRPQREERFELVPSFEAAVASPVISGRRGLGARRDEVERALTLVLAQLLRRLTDENALDAAPEWALEAQRDAALLGGKTHLERLGGVRLFPTTAGARASFDDLRRQVERFGALWVVRDPSCTLVPLDPERIALRLSEAHARALGRAIRVVDAKEELELDREARANRARPPMTSVALEGEERAWALATRTVSRAREGEVMVAALAPAHADERALVLALGEQLLGTTEPPGALPVLARVRSPALRPNRTFSGAERNAALTAIQALVVSLGEELVMESIPTPRTPMPVFVLDAEASGAMPIPKTRAIRGRLSLGSIDLAEDEGVVVVDRDVDDPDRAPLRTLRATAPKRDPEDVPLVGTVVLYGDDAQQAATSLDVVARHAYVALLARLTERLGARASLDADLDLAHVVHGASLGFGRAPEIRRDIALPFGRRGLATVGELVDVLGKSSTVVALAPDEDDQHAALARHPLFVVDGSLAAQRLVLALGSRLLSRSDALALALGVRRADGSIPPPPPPRATPEPPAPAAEKKTPKKSDEKPRAKPKKKASVSAAKVALTASASIASGPVAPLSVRAHARLSEAGRDAPVVVAPERSAPLVVLEDGELSLAGDSELLALAASTAVHRERAAVIVAAHALSVDRSVRDPIAALTRLLEASS